MPYITQLFSGFLILLGLVGFFTTGKTHVTALIPTIFGLVGLCFGMLALKPSLRKHMMHAAVIVFFLGFLGAASRLRNIFTATSLSKAQIASFLMALLCLVYTVLSVASFIRARSKR